MQRRIRASLGAAVAVALVLACSKKSAVSSVGSTDTMQSAPTTGTTATETGGGTPVTTSSATGTASATGTH